MPPPLRPAYYELAMAGLLAEMAAVELVGATVELDLQELGAVGPALVVDVRPCPAIPAGPGQVITATFKHASANVVDLVLSDCPVSSRGTPDDVAFSTSPSAISPSTSAGNPSTPETIGVTGNHSFWSLDRLEFVQVGELVIGERLQTLSGDTKWVQQKLPRPGPEPVYNLEVQGEHVYYVGNSGVLAHNAGCGPYSRKDAAELINRSQGRTVLTVSGHPLKHIPPAGAINSQIMAHARSGGGVVNTVWRNNRHAIQDLRNAMNQLSQEIAQLPANGILKRTVRLNKRRQGYESVDGGPASLRQYDELFVYFQKDANGLLHLQTMFLK